MMSQCLGKDTNNANAQGTEWGWGWARTLNVKCTHDKHPFKKEIWNNTAITILSFELQNTNKSKKMHSIISQKSGSASSRPTHSSETPPEFRILAEKVKSQKSKVTIQYGCFVMYKEKQLCLFVCVMKKLELTVLRKGYLFTCCYVAFMGKPSHIVQLSAGVGEHRIWQPLTFCFSNL